ncbi:MAG: hypothetical protein ACOCV8_04160 [Spirochaetota bacterium]
MKIMGKSIEKGLLPLLDISLLLFGIMIIILTYAKFEQAIDYYQEQKPEEDALAIALSLALQQESTSENIADERSKLKTNSEKIVENMVKLLKNEGKLILLKFGRDNKVRYKGGVLFEYENIIESKFNKETLEILKESIEKNKPIIIIGYPTTTQNTVYTGPVFDLKNEIEKYTEQEVLYLGLVNNIR